MDSLPAAFPKLVENIVSFSVVLQRDRDRAK